jgi:hypothetical protein
VRRAVMKDMVDLGHEGDFGEIMNSFNHTISSDVDLFLLNRTKQVNESRRQYNLKRLSKRQGAGAKGFIDDYVDDKIDPKCSFF